MTYNIAYIYHHKSEHQSVATQTHIWINYLDVKAFTFYVFGFTIHRLEQVIFQVTTFSLSDLPSITNISPTPVPSPSRPSRLGDPVTLTERDRGGEPGEPGTSVF